MTYKLFSYSHRIKKFKLRYINVHDIILDFIGSFCDNNDDLLNIFRNDRKVSETLRELQLFDKNNQLIIQN